MVLVYNFVTGEEMWVGDLGEGETIFLSFDTTKDSEGL